MTDFEPEDQPLPSLSRLLMLVTQAALNRGLIVRQFFIVPNMNPEGPHVAHIVSGTDPDFQKVEEVEDPELAGIMAATEADEREKQAEAARDSLTKLRDTLGDRNKGIGLDD